MMFILVPRRDVPRRRHRLSCRCLLEDGGGHSTGATAMLAWMGLPRECGPPSLVLLLMIPPLCPSDHSSCDRVSCDRVSCVRIAPPAIALPAIAYPVIALQKTKQVN